MLRRLLNLDRRWIFLGLAVSVIVPVCFPVRLPINPSKPVRAAYDFMNALPEGSLVLFSVDYGPSARVECHPMLVAALHHAFRKNLKVVCMSIWPEGQPFADQALQEVAPLYGKKYGVDYVNLGFKAGNEAVVVSLGLDFRGLFKYDAAGTPLSDLPLTASIKGLHDFALVCCYSSARPGALEHIRVTSSRYHMPLVIGCTAVSAPEYYPYFDSGQIQGLLGGLRGAAEYEILAQVQGTAVPGMDAQSLAHFFVVFLIVFSNVLYFIERGKRR